ncbi:Hypothetical predicted protein [Octopus vulgaris]|uniref:Uncharacterized protein n=2 Tax=Octopus TaxID=6643 RepID=A0AA36AXA4_OCTVU|nr:uncharacterized protein LOC115212073 isoform X2 [Octopus sinensis]XP_036358850.1 uncharacterized protein LOC115212073 isoform X2 [Octopus sinensis]XP_036358851.1 uncharacterized protein LOC115212073 isoform X2 [Octopus sinensis]CAI9723296.1 Hypothetical predicted protein [Octopus vulgaris]
MVVWLRRLLCNHIKLGLIPQYCTMGFLKMHTNIEIKSRVKDVEQLKEKVHLESGARTDLLIQEDIFFNVPQGRLKLRKTQGNKSKLIFYERKDTENAKESKFDISVIEDPMSLEIVLSRALGIKGIVKKRRELYIAGQTRIHIDDVEGLGNFMELEVMMKEDQEKLEGVKIAEDFMKKFNIQKSDLIAGAYIDLLHEKNSSN